METALDFARRGARVVMACRNLEKAQKVAGQIVFKKVLEFVYTLNNMLVELLVLPYFLLAVIIISFIKETCNTHCCTFFQIWYLIFSSLYTS